VSLSKRLLKRADLDDAAVAEFDCGSLPRDLELAEFLQLAETIDEVERGELLVWLFYNSSDEMVGFSSLGRSAWSYPGPRDSKVPIQIIPCLAVATVHQGKKHSREILDGTIAEAIDRREAVSDILGLFVHVENSVAAGLYRKSLFDDFGKPREIDGQLYQRMILKLADAEAE
jgi:ribosomal protein S18 acetylase RimI-like enzyme